MLLVDNRHLGPPRSLIRTFFFFFMYTCYIHILIFIYLYIYIIRKSSVCVYVSVVSMCMYLPCMISECSKVLDPLHHFIHHRPHLSTPSVFFSPFARSFITKFLECVVKHPNYHAFCILAVYNSLTKSSIKFSSSRRVTITIRCDPINGCFVRDNGLARCRSTLTCFALHMGK